MKSHFLFTKKQRNGIFLLILLVLLIQALYHVSDFSSEIDLGNPEKINMFLSERDSMIQVRQKQDAFKIYPFNPNYITDHKGYTLGMSNEEIDRLLEFRKQGKWVNSADEFQKVTLMSDSLLNTMSPYFKFPDWVNKRQNKPKTTAFFKSDKTTEQKIDLNQATAVELQKVYGVGPAFSKRIIAYRTKVNGFANEIELTEIYGLSPEVIEEIKKHFTIKTPRQIDKIPLNSASVSELVKIKYIDYEIAHEIVEQRTLRDGFTDFNELLKIKDFPTVKLEIIKLYLTLN